MAKDSNKTSIRFLAFGRSSPETMNKGMCSEKFIDFRIT